MLRSPKTIQILSFLGGLLISTVAMSERSYAKKYDGALALNSENLFGTIAFVPGAIRKGQIGNINSYAVVKNNGSIQLSDQNGYCFIATHFNPESSGTPLVYEFSTTLTDNDTSIVIDPGKIRTADITNNNASTNFPSYCIEAREPGIKFLVEIEIRYLGQTLTRQFTVVFQ